MKHVTRRASLFSHIVSHRHAAPELLRGDGDVDAHGSLPAAENLGVQLEPNRSGLPPLHWIGQLQWLRDINPILPQSLLVIAMESGRLSGAVPRTHVLDSRSNLGVQLALGVDLLSAAHADCQLKLTGQMQSWPSQASS